MASQCGRGNEDAGAERRAHADVAGDAGDGADDDEAALAERQRVADARIELGEERRLDHDARAVLQFRPRAPGLGADLAVERVAALDGRDLHEAGAAVRGT